jgi:hypothetical protein
METGVTALSTLPDNNIAGRPMSATVITPVTHTVVPATALCVCTAAYSLCVVNAGVVFRDLTSV